MLVVLGVVAAAACGAKGPPQAPLRPIPDAVSVFSIERDGAAITLRILVPDTNTDGSTPPAVDRIDIYAVTQAADAPAPGTTELIVPANIIGSIPIRPAPKPEKEKKPKEGDAAPQPKPDVPPDPRPAPGDLASYIDMTPPDDASVRYFAAVASTGRRRSRTGSILPVPLAGAPATPANLKIDYTEQKLTLAWDTASADARYLIEETDKQGGSPKRLSASPQELATYEEPVAFGKSRCLAVRPALVKGSVVILGAASAPVCVTPTDRFPPPVPGGLQAVAADPGAGVEVLWGSVQAADLAGYIVLRGDGANGTLQPLTPTPIASSPYRDPTARAGNTYVYAVAAVDKAGNKSEASNQSSATARTPAPSVRHER